MSLRCPPIRTLLLALTVASAHAQTIPITAPRKPHPKPSQSPWNPNVILLDPAHGGTDSGANLSPQSDPASLEKDATVAFAGRLRTLLAARGFTVILTHDSASDAPAPDQRAEAANRSRAVACILLHASNGGHGVHLFTSSLTPAPAEDPDAIPDIQLWATAQSATIPQSLLLAKTLSDALYAIRVPLLVGQASVPPIDSLTCPAVAVELSPLIPSADADTPTQASDPAYQQRIAEALASALATWRTHIVAQAAFPTPAPSAKPTPSPTRPPKSIPIETPATLPETPPAKPPAGSPPR